MEGGERSPCETGLAGETGTEGRRAQGARAPSDEAAENGGLAGTRATFGIKGTGHPGGKSEEGAARCRPAIGRQWLCPEDWFGERAWNVMVKAAHSEKAMRAMRATAGSP